MSGRGRPPKTAEPRAAMGAAGAMGARVARVALCGVALLCALGLAQRPPGGLSCGPGRHLHGTGTSARCCRSCTPGKAGREPLRGGQSAAPRPPVLRASFPGPEP